MLQVTVSLGERTYNVLVGENLVARAGEFISETVKPASVLLVSDRQVADIYLGPALKSLRGAGLHVSQAIVPPGENSKSIDHVMLLYEACFGARLERASCVVALGGGVVGDLVGFCAATYLRGLPFVQIPTTLLAQVDSSVGGKTGINLPGGKNLVGSFHQPRLVLADVATLHTLEAREFATGMAEIIKHAVIRDGAMFDWLHEHAEEIDRRDNSTMAQLVARNVAIKAEVVAADEHEGGLRAILNYGHTVGHAIERVAAYGTYTHGEAVALGMVAEAEIAGIRGEIALADLQQQRRLLQRFDLPTHLRRALSADDLMAAMAHDKKVVAGRLRFVLPEAIGRVHIVNDVTADELRQALRILEPKA